jgi:hypothetical protein
VTSLFELIPGCCSAQPSSQPRMFFPQLIMHDVRLHSAGRTFSNLQSTLAVSHVCRRWRSRDSAKRHRPHNVRALVVSSPVRSRWNCRIEAIQSRGQGMFPRCHRYASVLTEFSLWFEFNASIFESELLSTRPQHILPNSSGDCVLGHPYSPNSSSRSR